MKRGGIINRQLATVIAEMGHTDALTVCDCGLPIPEGKRLIDLSVTKGFPRLTDILEAINKDMVIEKVILASEILDCNPEMHRELLKLFEGKEIVYLDHKEFKPMAAANSKAYVRSGEATPYSNVILVSGVEF